MDKQEEKATILNKKISNTHILKIKNGLLNIPIEFQSIFYDKNYTAYYFNIQLLLMRLNIIPLLTLILVRFTGS